MINPESPNRELPQPHGMRFLSCKNCDTPYMTDEYIMIQCTNPDCNRYICLLDDCFKTFAHKCTFYDHANVKHRSKGDRNQCYTCKAPKIRDGSTQNGKCSTCGVYWCLLKNCNFEFSKIVLLEHHLDKHH